MSRPDRIVHHVFAEVALLLVGVGDGVAAQGVAVPAAGHVFGRACGDVVGAAESVVILAQRGVMAGNSWRLAQADSASAARASAWRVFRILVAFNIPFRSHH